MPCFAVQTCDACDVLSHHLEVGKESTLHLGISQIRYCIYGYLNSFSNLLKAPPRDTERTSGVIVPGLERENSTRLQIDAATI
jgi:hypothetical protein